MAKLAEWMGKLFDGTVEYFALFLLGVIMYGGWRWLVCEFNRMIDIYDGKLESLKLNIDDLDERDGALEKKAKKISEESEKKMSALIEMSFKECNGEIGKVKSKFKEEMKHVDEVCEDRFSQVSELKGAHNELKKCLGNLEKEHRENLIESKLKASHLEKEVEGIHKTVDKLFDMLGNIDEKLNKLIGATNGIN